MDDLFPLPYPKFSPKQAEAWVPLACQLALRSLPIRDIAGKFKCPISTLRDSDEVMEAVRAGHADHRLAIENALFQDAMLNPMAFEDPMERATIRTVRANALKILKNSIDKKEEFVPPAEQEKLRRLSDAELEKALQEFKNGTTG